MSRGAETLVYDADEAGDDEERSHADGHVTATTRSGAVGSFRGVVVARGPRDDYDAIPGAREGHSGSRHDGSDHLRRFFFRVCSLAMS